MCTHILAFGEIVTMFYCDITVDLLLQLMIKCYYISGNVFHFLKMQNTFEMVAADLMLCIKIILSFFYRLDTVYGLSRIPSISIYGFVQIIHKTIYFVYSIHFMDNINLLTKRYTFAFSI